MRMVTQGFRAGGAVARDLYKRRAWQLLQGRVFVPCACFQACRATSYLRPGEDPLACVIRSADEFDIKLC